VFEYIERNKFAMLKVFEGAVTFESLSKFSYKDACKFFKDAIKIAEHHQKELEQIKAQQNNVKKLSNKI